MKHTLKYKIACKKIGYNISAISDFISILILIIKTKMSEYVFEL